MQSCWLTHSAGVCMQTLTLPYLWNTSFCAYLRLFFFYHAAFIRITNYSHPNFRELRSAISRCAGLLQFQPVQFAGKKPSTLSWTIGYFRNKAVCCCKVFKDISVSLNKEIFSQPTTITVMLKLPSGRARFKKWGSGSQAQHTKAECTAEKMQLVSGERLLQIVTGCAECSTLTCVDKNNILKWQLLRKGRGFTQG